MAITIDDFKALLQDESAAADVKAIIKAAGFETPDDIQALKNNSFQLKAEKIKALEIAKELQKRLDDFDLEGYEQYKSGTGSAKAQPQAERELQKLRKELEEKSAAFSKIENDYNDTVIKSELRSVFDATGIDSIHAPLLIDAFSRKAKVEIDGSRRSVIIDNGDGIGLPASDYFKTWTASDNGKAYLKKPVNSGAGSQKFDGTPKGTISRSEFDKLSGQEQRAILKTATIQD